MMGSVDVLLTALVASCFLNTEFHRCRHIRFAITVIYWLAVAELRCSLLMATVQSLRRTW